MCLCARIEVNHYIKGIHLDSYLQTFGFMILFTIIVSVGVHFMLKENRYHRIIKKYGMN